ncbi:hypothetical protein GGQ08_001522 [Salinibacter ruber]|uniref:DUF4385 domain-containing protein n=1 Tax=Salinibacter ruber TaxID=146919 RepID=UPI000E580E58|nr:DUF4385 domain-containing protein [Salinibacter ruber]MCS3650229.1 hypothetical protein [Salinibacter ruber]MCS3653482.1 hypothetical protein [Salinibacter ruber]
MAGAYETDFRAHPEAYRYDSSEQGVFKVQPYKDELLPDWGFKDEAAAEAAVEALWEAYERYRAADDFVGMDMARKYLQMGFTRAMRYAKYPGGRKYEDDGTEREPEQWADPEKRAAAVVFRNAWQALTDDPAYERLKEHHQNEVYDPAASPMVD